MDDHALASSLASTARNLLARLRSDGVAGPELGREGDRQAHDLLVGLLERHRPDDAVLSEEGDPVPPGARSGRLWIIDPLDGTREYCDRRDDWAVHVALAERGELTAGAVALSSGDTHSTASPVPLPAPADRRLRVAVSRSHRPPLVDELAGVLDVQPVPMGSAGVKAVAVCTGRVDAYVHAGGQYQWDSAAPVAVALAAGAHASRLDGTPLDYRSSDPRTEDLLVCRPEVAPALLDALAGLRSSARG